MSFVTALKILRGKNQAGPNIIIPVFIKLFKCKDKELRKTLHSFIISDLKELNRKKKSV
jgi:protein SDA1